MKTLKCSDSETIFVQTILFTVSYTAAPKSSEEEVGTPNQKNLVISGKSVSVREKGLVVVPALETQSKTKAQQAESHNETAETQTRMTSQ